MKYVFYFIQSFLIILISLEILSDKKIERILKIMYLSKLSTSLDYLFVVTALSLFVTVLLKNYFSINIILSMIVSLILPGYVLLRLMKIKQSPLETAVLSFTLSLSITGIISTLVFSTIELHEQRTLILISTYLFLSILPIAKKQFEKKEEFSRNSISQKLYTLNLLEVFLLALFVFFFIFIMVLLYPRVGLDAGLDPYRYFGIARSLDRSSACLWNTFDQAVVYFLAIPSEPLSYDALVSFQSLMAYLGLFLLPSFYIMAKTYLTEIDERLPILATVFFFAFSGFGWFFFASNKLANPTYPELSLLSDAVFNTYWDVSRNGGPRQWQLFRAETIGAIVFFTLIYILNKKEVSRGKYVLLSFLLILGEAFLYLPLLILFISVLCAAFFLIPQIKLRLRDTLLASAFGLSITLFITFTNDFIFNRISLLQYTYIATMAIGTLSLYFLIPRLWKGLNLTVFLKRSDFFTSALIFIYLGLLITWFLNPYSFNYSDISSMIFNVPLSLYPMLLGVNGLLALMGINVILKNHKSKTIVFFLIFLGSVFGFLQLTSFINMNFFITGFFERRLLLFFIPACSMIAPIVLLEKVGKKQILDGSKKTLFSNTKTIGSTLLIGIIVVSGISSTFLSAEYWYYRGVENEKRGGILSREEMNALNYLYETCSNNSKQPEQHEDIIYSAPGGLGSRCYLALTGVYAADKQNYPLFSSIHPEEALTVLYQAPALYSYLYLHKRDLDILKGEYKESYLNQHLLQYISEAYKNSEVKIYKIQGSPPVPSSELALVIPCNYNTIDSLFGYDILSLGKYNYTVAFDSDTNIDSKIIVLPFDKPGTSPEENFSDYLNNKFVEKIIILNTDGYGSLANNLFTSGTGNWFLKVNSTNLFLHPFGDYQKVLTDYNASSLSNVAEFIVDNDEINHYLPINHDNGSSFWTPYVTGTGKVGIPQLNDNPEIKVAGLNGLQINVADGQYGKWGVNHNFGSPQNWSNYDFLTFYWYGYGNGRYYQLACLSGKGNSYFYFKDNWGGWKKLIFPLRMPIGKHIIGDIEIEKTFSANPVDWSNINRLLIGMEGENNVMKGTWYLDELSIDVGKWIIVEATMPARSNDTNDLKLYNFNGSIYSSIVLPADREKIQLNSFYLLDGLRSDLLYNDTHSGEITFEKGDDVTKIIISLKMPPEDNRDSEFSGLSQARFKFEYNNNEKIKVSKILGKTDNLTLPTKIEVIPLNVKENVEVMGWYAGDSGTAPFATRTHINGKDVIYSNVYPLIETLLSNEESKTQIFLNLGNLISIIGLDLPKYNGNPPWIGDINAFVFKEALISGTIEVKSNSVLFPSKFSPIKLNMTSKNQQRSLFNVTSLTVEGNDNISLHASNLKILQGMGFYTQIYTNNPKITVSGDNITLNIGYSNGTYAALSYSSALELSFYNDHALYIRKPDFLIDGTALFKEAYVWGQQLTHKFKGVVKTDIYKNDVQINGTIEFNVPLSGTFTHARGFTWSGPVKLDVSLIKWDEWESLRETFSPMAWLMVFSVFMVSWNLYSRSSNKRLKN